MTMGDVLALVAGVALSFFMIANVNVPSVLVTRPPADQLVYEVLRFFQAATLALSAVILRRVAVYRRMPSASEWLVILVASSMPGDWPWLQVDRWIYSCRWAFPLLDAVSSIGVRWLGALLFSAAVVIGLVVFRLGRSLFPAWLKTVLIAWVALLAMSGPLWVISQHGADLISPSGGFGPGAASTLFRGVCQLIAGLPMGLLFGVPALAAVIDRRQGRRRNWAEWAAIGASTLIGFASMNLIRWDFATLGLAYLAERGLAMAWLLAVVVFSRSILIHLGPAWRRWIEGLSDGHQSSPSAADSDASIRST